MATTDEDDPDLEHVGPDEPAWWRGHQVGVLGTVRERARLLDRGKVGTFAEPELEALAVRLEAMRRG